MASVSGQGTTFNLPNYVGELFNITPADTTFLSMIGGLTGGRSVRSKSFTWQTVDNAAAAQPSVLEGADATFAERTRSEVENVVQIFQEGVEVSYTKQAATGQLDGQSIIGNQPVDDEVDFQVRLKLEQMARDIEYSFLQGTYAKPADNLTARKTRGLLSAITSNTVAAATTDLAKSQIDELLREMYASGAPFRNVVIFANALQKQRLSNIYGYAPEDRNIGGVNVQQIETDFGRLGVTLNRFMPAAQLLFAEVSVCRPVFLEVPGKGFLFREPLSKSGSADKEQIYGEIGLEYGPEQWHGSITGLTTS
jgi:hypothetical protein